MSRSAPSQQACQSLALRSTVSTDKEVPLDVDETTFPMDVTEEDPSSRPWNYKPEGYLVVITADTEEARRAETALAQAGFSPKDIKRYNREADPGEPSGIHAATQHHHQAGCHLRR
jgi:hypothetical protein